MSFILFSLPLFIYSGDHFDLERHTYEKNELGLPRKIPSLIDTMFEGRRFEFSRSTLCFFFAVSIIQFSTTIAAKLHIFLQDMTADVMKLLGYLLKVGLHGFDSVSYTNYG